MSRRVRFVALALGALAAPVLVWGLRFGDRGGLLAAPRRAAADGRRGIFGAHSRSLGRAGARGARGRRMQGALGEPRRSGRRRGQSDGRRRRSQVLLASGGRPSRGGARARSSAGASAHRVGRVYLDPAARAQRRPPSAQPRRQALRNGARGAHRVVALQARDPRAVSESRPLWAGAPRDGSCESLLFRARRRAISRSPRRRSWRGCRAVLRCTIPRRGRTRIARRRNRVLARLWSNGR